uniref:Polyphenolic adhesive protein 1-like protein n=1 Tax=Perkinsus chesapeaki TaxID=330153 RepID=A7YXM6_PERCH|nr:polyphenolic adhesive protein 1-like protein [Perkinsus chesapeaki]
MSTFPVAVLRLVTISLALHMTVSTCVRIYIGRTARRGASTFLMKTLYPVSPLNVSLARQRLKLPSLARLRLKLPSLARLRLKLPSLARLRLKLPSLARLRLKLPSLARLRLKLPSLARLRLKLPSLARLRLKLPSLARLRLKLPSLARLRLKLPSLARLRLKLPSLARLRLKLPSLARQRLKLPLPLPRLASLSPCLTNVYLEARKSSAATTGLSPYAGAFTGQTPPINISAVISVMVNVVMVIPARL